MLKPTQTRGQSTVQFDRVKEVIRFRRPATGMLLPPRPSMSRCMLKPTQNHPHRQKFRIPIHVTDEVNVIENVNKPYRRELGELDELGYDVV